MRLELLVLAATVFFMVDAYYEGKYLKKLMSWKKYYQIAFYGVIGLGIYWMLKKNPKHSKNVLLSANQMLKTMPIDRGGWSPFLDVTQRGIESMTNGANSFFALDGTGAGAGVGRQPTKRSVSETKKKYVASQQDWKCGHCGHKLTHTFEIDHRVRLEYGGSNEVDNLVALCRNCHGNKTAQENM
jgi:HNH endonuclease